jgi:hypothetical protein
MKTISWREFHFIVHLIFGGCPRLRNWPKWDRYNFPQRVQKDLYFVNRIEIWGKISMRGALISSLSLSIISELFVRYIPVREIMTLAHVSSPRCHLLPVGDDSAHLAPVFHLALSLGSRIVGNYSMSTRLSPDLSIVRRWMLINCYPV